MKLFFSIVSALFVFNVNASQVEIRQVAGALQSTESHYSHNFGIVWVNSRVVASYNLRNTGVTPLSFGRAYVYGGEFSAHHSCDRIVLPNEICTFSIYYWPMFEGISSGRFILSFIEDEVIFDLWGQARR